MGSRFKFDVQKEQSAVKTAIVVKYFAVWSRIMKKHKRIGYIDLYSGPGKYDRGTYSTPLIILKQIISDDVLAEKVVTYFNDKDEVCYKNLKDNIDSLEGINKLKFYPQVENKEVNKSIADYFGNKKLIPCFSFIDPAGYCGLSMDLIQALGKDYGSDLIFFFNYNDINRGLTNNKVTEHMILLFGEEHYNGLIEQLSDVVEPMERELIILNRLAQAIKDNGIEYILPFRFVFERKERTSHYLIFASKNFLGYHIMKSIMHQEGEKDIDGVGKYEFIPSCNKCGKQLSLIDMFNSSLPELKQHLIDNYDGKHGTVYDLYEYDSVNNRYLLKHYKQVLLELEEEEKIICSPIREVRRKIKGKPTLGDKVKITFLKKE